MKDGLRRAINDAIARRLAPEECYVQGCEYFRQGRVASIEEGAKIVRAVVRGSREYAVTLSSDAGILHHTCDCAQGAEGTFCKHSVAAALGWLSRDDVQETPARRGKTKEPTAEDIEKVLRNEDKDTLVRMILDWANDDDRLYDRLVQHTARRSSPSDAKAAAARAFSRAVRVRGFLPYREAGAWARGVDEAIDNIARLLEDGEAAAAMELCES